MPYSKMVDTVDNAPSPSTTGTQNLNYVVKDYLLMHATVFRELMDLKKVFLFKT